MTNLCRGVRRGRLTALGGTGDGGVRVGTEGDAAADAGRQPVGDVGDAARRTRRACVDEEVVTGVTH